MSPIPVSKTKIIPPRRRAELLTRRRLLDMLSDALDRRLILVSAPAGYGKTSLLIDLVHHSEMPFCWLALDELDRDPQRFAAYFIAALSERFPGFGPQSRSVLDGMKSFEEEMERLVVTAINELVDQVSEHFAFVLDDFHLLDGVEPIQRFVNRFVQLMDDNSHLIISSRTLASLNDLLLFAARDQVVGLDYSALAFQPGELQALLAQNRNLHISDEEAARLIEESEGWITGLQFSDSGILRQNTARSIFEDSAGLFEYLGQQVLDRQPPELRKFVLQTSLLDEFDASLCEKVLAPLYSEPQDWHDWMRRIARNNLFALPVGEEGKWLRYHHLFRDFIRERFHREYPEEITPILLRLEQTYESMAEWEKAHQICKLLDDTTLLAEMIERAGTFMIQRAHLTLASWLGELPSSLLRTRPGLLSIRGVIARLKDDLHESVSLLNEAERMFRMRQDEEGLALTLSRRGITYWRLGEYNAALHDADEVVRLTEERPPRHPLYAEALRLKGNILFRMGEARRSIDFLEKSLELYERLGESASIPTLLMETGIVYRAMGDFTQAQNAYEKALHIWHAEGNLFSQAYLLNNLGVLYHLSGQYEKAVLSFEEGLLCARRSRNGRLDALISAGLGDLYTDLADFEMAHQSYQYAHELAQDTGDRFLLHYLALAQANLAVFQGDFRAAHEWIERAGDSIRGGGSKSEIGFLFLVNGRIHLWEGNPHGAVENFERAEREFNEGGRQTDADQARVWRAAALYKSKNSEQALQIINDIHANGRAISHTAVSAISQARNWLGNLRNHPGLNRGARNLFAQADRLVSEIPAIRRHLRREVNVISPSAPRLAIYAFGQAAVHVNGRVLNISDWHTQSVRDLFFYLLSASRPLTKEQIGEALWPEKYDSARLKLRFKNEIYRLRRAVGQEVIQYHDVFYMFNREYDYEYDVEAFESFLARARAASSPEDQINYYKRAVDLVRGPFLNDLDMDWIIPERERLSRLYLDALASLADLYLKQGNPQNAVDICRRAIEYDPGFETAYQIAMQAFARLGDAVSIKQMYQACREAMKKEFNMPPSAETEEIYRRLAE